MRSQKWYFRSLKLVGIQLPPHLAHPPFFDQLVASWPRRKPLPTWSWPGMVTVANGSDRLIAASDWFPTNRGSLGESPRLSLLTLLPIGARAALPLREHEPWARQPLESTHFTLQRFIAFSTAALLFSWHVNNRRQRLLCTVVVVPLSLEFYRFVSKNTLHYLKPMIIEFKRIETKNRI